MPEYKIVQEDGYRSLVTIWKGFTPQEDEMAKKILRGIFEKQKRIEFHYKDGTVKHIVRRSGDIWLNNNKEPFGSETAFNVWFEKELPKVVKALKYCEEPEELEETITRQ